MAGLIRRETDGRVAVLSLARPDRHNAFNDEMEAELAAAVDEAIADREVRAIVLRGDGRSFSSGRDVSALGQRPEGVSDLEFVAGFQRSRKRMYESPKPVVAAVKGAVLGMGLEIAACADFRISSTDAVFAFPEVNYGIITDTGGAPFAALLAGPARAKYLVMTGDKIDAQTALSWGLVEFVVEPDELDDRALELARELAAKAPLAVQHAKKIVDGLYADTVRAGMREELLVQSLLFTTEDYAEMRKALREKTTPEFRGR